MQYPLRNWRGDCAVGRRADLPLKVRPPATAFLLTFNSWIGDLNSIRAPDRKSSRLSINYFLLRAGNWETLDLNSGRAKNVPNCNRELVSRSRTKGFSCIPNQQPGLTPIPLSRTFPNPFKVLDCENKDKVVTRGI